MPLIFVTDNFAVDPTDVSCLEAYTHWRNSDSPSGDSFMDHAGTVVVQKNGRKTYLKHMTVKQVHSLIYPKDEERHGIG